MKKHLLTILAISSLLLASCGGSDDPVKPDETAPAVPTGLALHTAADHALTLQWDRMTDAVSYDWTLSKGGAEVKKGSVTARNVQVPDLEPATTYKFGVRSVNAAGTSGWAYVDATTTGKPAGQDYASFKIPAAEEDGVARAFPGAEGGGMYTTGGRGGEVYHVTSLSDSGSGSLRAGIEKKRGAQSPMTIVFDVAGVIALEKSLEIKYGDLTIAGQTAPGDGICIKNYPTVVKADNVIIRFIRFRMGDEKQTADDAIWGRRQERIILDHCSMSWSTDECASFYGNEFFTMQWCILTESLTNSVHDKGSHGFGGIWGGKNATFHHNLLANHNNRTPRFDHPMVYENPDNPARRGNVDYRNNVNYNWGSGNGCYGGDGGFFNMVGNYYKAGPASANRPYYIEANGVYKYEYKDGGTSHTTYYAYGFPHLYLKDNYHSAGVSSSYPNGVYWKEINGNKGSDGKTVTSDGCLLASELEILGENGKKVSVQTHSAQDAFAKVLEKAGASLRRDRVDERAVHDAKNGTATYPDGGKGSKNGIIDTQSAVGGWPSYSATAEELARVNKDTADKDGDGMPDWFEEQFGLDKSKDDGKAKTLDKNNRYTNLEMYLHFLVRDIMYY